MARHLELRTVDMDREYSRLRGRDKRCPERCSTREKAHRPRPQSNHNGRRARKEKLGRASRHCGWRHTGALRQTDDRIGYLETKMELHGATAEASTVLILCALLQEKRLKSKGKKHSWSIAGIFKAGITITWCSWRSRRLFLPKG
jgi:hypothetical protein